MKYLKLLAAVAALLGAAACMCVQPKAKLTVEGTHGPEVKQVSYKLEVCTE
jgi:hypothetical protein